MPIEQDEDQQRRAARFDFWLFLSEWLVVFGVAGVAVFLRQ
jgi:hypothetical protein